MCMLGSVLFSLLKRDHCASRGSQRHLIGCARSHAWVQPHIFICILSSTGGCGSLGCFLLPPLLYTMLRRKGSLRGRHLFTWPRLSLGRRAVCAHCKRTSKGRHVPGLPTHSAGEHPAPAPPKLAKLTKPVFQCYTNSPLCCRW